MNSKMFLWDYKIRKEAKFNRSGKLERSIIEDIYFAILKKGLTFH
jgi:hypothetical protein